MSRQLVECIPNFSEGRDPSVVEEIQAAILSVSGVTMLDQHSDRDHNRTVMTFVAAPEQAGEAAFLGIAKAAELIDLNQQEGEHPRIGATDVVPFVPISGVTMKDCVALAGALAERVSSELGIPVYLYEEAARVPQRVNLENIRRGEYEGLKEAIQTDPARAPDYGPRSLGPAGATVIGARAPLVAYNVYLTTDDVSIAKKIARAIRHSSGGLRYVKSIGLEVDGRAQVSMNLTNYRKTPIARVFELIRREAGRFGVSIHQSELVGLIPQDAMVEAARWYLQLDQFEEDQLLENQLAANQTHSDDGDLLEKLAEGTPTPGGGSASAHVGATAAALVAMVARLTIGKKRYAEVGARMEEIAAAADELRADLVEAVQLDAEAFQAVMKAIRLPKDNDEEKRARMEALELATHRAAEVPLHVAAVSSEILALAAEAAKRGNANAISDAGAAGAMARSAIQAAALNVRINAQSARDEAAVKSWLEELDRIEREAELSFGSLRTALAERGDLVLT